MSNKISTNQLTPGATFRITGRTEFGRIAKKVEGAELQKENDDRAKKGWTTIDVPHTRMTIYDAAVIPNSGNNTQLTLEEQYALERMFLSKAHGQSPCFTGMNKGNSLPWVYYQPTPQSPAQQINLEKELASGLACTIYLSVYKPKGAGKNNGVSLDGIILHDAPVYFAGGNDSGASVLQKYGINIDPNTALPAQPPLNYDGEPDVMQNADPENAVPYAQQPVANYAQPQQPVYTAAPAGVQPNFQQPAPAVGVQPNFTPAGVAPTGIKFDPNATPNG